MAVRDTEAFIREKAEQYDPNIDLTSGAPFDKTVIQPIVRRFGQDPFSVDLSTFLNDRLEQAYPELATKEGDAVTDLLNKPVTLLWDPIVREITLIKQMLRRPRLLQQPPECRNQPSELHHFQDRPALLPAGDPEHPHRRDAAEHRRRWCLLLRHQRHRRVGW
jgi:hypothetical protein